MIRRAPLVLAAVLLATCGGGPTPPAPTPVIDPPGISCPADVTVTGVTGALQAVTFSAPVVTGGATPVTSTCTPASGAAFPLGTTPVACAATDAQARRATCSFNVRLTGFSLAVTKFETLGDSLTAGENGLPLPSFIDPPNSYPTKLQALLDSAYPGQGISVVNRGFNGERIEETYALLPGHLAADRPQAVLLLGGYNNLTNPCFTGLANTPACEAAVDQVVFGVQDCIRLVKESPVGIKYVFVSTLTPTGPVAPNSPRDLRIASEATLEVNRRIRERVAAEGVILVDTHARFVGHEAEYISIDGLHLRPAGYQAIADAFFAAIKATVPQTPLSFVSGRR